jgi:hypothetical protein
MGFINDYEAPINNNIGFYGYDNFILRNYNEYMDSFKVIKN